MAEQQGDQPVEKVGKAVQQAASRETTPAPVRRRRATRFQVTLLVLLVALAVLAALVTMTTTQNADLYVTRGLQSDSSPLLSSLMIATSWAGYPPQSFAVVGIVVLFLFGIGLRWEALAALIAVMMEEGFDLVIKDAIHRPRPSSDLVHVLVTLHSYSFPSGHVTFYTAFFGFAVFLAYTLVRRPWLRWILMVLFGIPILLIGASRIYLGEHWASDVLGGYLLGSMSLMLSVAVYRWGKGRFFVRQPVAAERKPS